MEPCIWDKWPISFNSIKTVPLKIAKSNHIFPLNDDGAYLSIAVQEDFTNDNLESLQFLLKRKITPYLATKETIAERIEKYYMQQSPGLSIASEPKVLFNTSHTPVEQLVQSIINQAIDSGVSDIHFEPQAQALLIRFRIDGYLKIVRLGQSIPSENVIAHVKLLAHLSLDQKRLPQDGRLSWNHAGKGYDLRVSCVPSIYGEALVIRILDREGLNVDFNDLGLLPDHARTLEKVLSSTDGLVLLCGPTGSGKTTTLYSALKFRNKLAKKIITVEDPVEYQFAEFSQIPVRDAVGLTFPNALRSILRQSPDTIMIGEIRDSETAQIAINASLTGHLVLSTIHAQDTFGVLSRLQDLGIKPLLLASALKAIVGQRLVRKLCPHCKQPFTPSPEALLLVNLTEADLQHKLIYRAGGCKLCNFTGYKGRVGVFEFFLLNSDLSNAIHQGFSLGDISFLTKATSIQSLRDDALDKLFQGLTSLEEISVI